MGAWIRTQGTKPMETVDRLRKRVLLRLQQLDMFLVLSESGSIRVTADTVGMSQSAVSKSLKELEGMLKTPLFLRTPSGLKPLPAAEIFERFARQSIRGYNAMITELARQQGKDLRPSSFGTIRGLPQQLLGRALTTVRANYEHVMTRVQVDLPQSLFDRLLNGKLELVLGYLPEQRDSEHLRCLTIASDTIIAVAPATHPVFDHDTSLSDFPWCVPQPSCRLRQQLDEALHRAGIAWPKQIVELEPMPIGTDLLQGDAILWTTQSFADAWLEQGLLKEVSLPFTAPVAKIGCFRAAHRPLSLVALEVWRDLATSARLGAQISQLPARPIPPAPTSHNAIRNPRPGKDPSHSIAT